MNEIIKKMKKTPNKLWGQIAQGRNLSNTKVINKWITTCLRKFGPDPKKKSLIV